jgi:hypothetical protein
MPRMLPDEWEKKQATIQSKPGMTFSLNGIIHTHFSLTLSLFTASDNFKTPLLAAIKLGDFLRFAGNYPFLSPFPHSQPVSSYCPHSFLPLQSFGFIRNTLPPLSYSLTLEEMVLKDITQVQRTSTMTLINKQPNLPFSLRLPWMLNSM